MKTAEVKLWQRTVTAISLHEDQPLYIFYDSVSGNDANIWSMLMMSEGAVTTPVGPVTPERRMHNFKDLQQLPVATTVKNTAPGWNRFTFNGQAWKKHPAGGIDWYLYTSSSKAQSFTISQWGTSWQSNVEAAEFKRTNGREYTEEQQILRLQSKEPFFSILIPFNKGDRSYERSITTLTGRKIQVKQDDDIITISDDGVVIKRSDADILALLKTGKKINNGRIALEGGVMGLEYSKNELVIRVHGNPGIRTIKLPFKTVRPQGKYTDTRIGSAQANTVITIDYKNNKTDLPAGQKGYTEYIFTITE